MVRRSTSLPGKQVLRSRYGEKVNLPAQYTDAHTLPDTHPCQPSEQVIRSRDKEKVNFLLGEQVMRSRYSEK
jgi:hypothetical protein